MAKYFVDQCKSWPLNFRKAFYFGVDMPHALAAFAVAGSESTSAGTASTEQSFACSIGLVDAASYSQGRSGRHSEDVPHIGAFDCDFNSFEF